ncbi:MAG: helix-turn-helix transcriptional regulator [Clostridia bacterium]|nr:helix-turn-helix transcriptional regulator [Clostridia bacterium]
MTHAYDESVVTYAMDNLGCALDYVINFLGVSGDEFLKLFVSTGIADEFGIGNPRYVTGMSGRDMADEVFSICGKTVPEINGDVNGDYSKEYWCGYILAYYQWYSGLPFRKILSVLTFEKLMNSYVLHEADESKAVDVFDCAVRAESFLARVRKKRGLTQAELAEKSGVSLRSIQLYEQKKNDINKAQYNNLKAIAKVLRCHIEDITE